MLETSTALEVEWNPPYHGENDYIPQPTIIVDIAHAEFLKSFNSIKFNV